MEFQVLGPLAVVDGESPVPLGRRKQRALLALLLLHPNEALSPSRLIEELWNGRPPPRATQSLQAYVSNLRRVLGAERAQNGRQSLLPLQPGGYVLSVEAERIDALRFERLITDARAARADGDDAAAESFYDAALALWRGDVLADVADELPQQPAIARLNELRLTAIEERLDGKLASGHHAEVVSELDALVMSHPLRERLREQLTLALYRAGRQADALEHLRRGRTLLVEELGIEPGPALKRMEQLILNQSPELDWRASLSPPPAAVSPPITGRNRLVGREHEVERLRKAWEQTAHGHGHGHGRGRVVLVAGEPGIGKTRLAEELSAHVAANGGLVYWGRSFEVGGAPTFWPWVQALSDVVDELDTADLRRLLGRRAGTVAQLVPQIEDRLEDVETVHNVEATEARFRLYDGVIRFVLRLAASRPLAIVLDDLHWADAPSLDLLRLLSARIREAPVLVVATYRDTETARDGALATALAGLAREAPLERLELSGLAVSDVARFLNERLGTRPSEQLASRVYERTDGNPFFVSEVAQLLREHGPVEARCSDDAWRQIPAGVREVLQRRLDRLASESVEVLEAAAVIGRDFTTPLLERATGRTAVELLEALDPAIAAGLVTAGGESAHEYRFAHALVRETIYDGLPRARRATLHGAIAAALDEVAGDRRLSEVAHHYEQAVAIGFAEHAVDALLRAADKAQRAVAFEQAERHLRSALDILDDYPDSRREVAALSRLTALLVMTQGYTAQELPQLGERVRTAAAEAEDSPDVADVMWTLWTYTCVRAEFETALAVADTLIARGRRTSDRAGLAAGLQARGTSLWHVGRVAEAVAALQDAIATAGELDDEEFRNRSLQHPSLIARTHASHALWLQGDDEGAERVITEARALADTIGTPYEQAFSLYLSGWHSVVKGDFQAGERWCREALRMCHDRGFRQLRAFTGIMLGAAEAHTGRPDEGVERLKEGIEAFLATGSRMLGHFHQALLADALLAAGRVAEAAEAVENALAESRTTGETFYLSEVLRLKATTVMRSSGNADEARALLVESLQVAREQGAHAIAERAEATLARIGAPAGGPA